jgi:hypothetical protein
MPAVLLFCVLFCVRPAAQNAQRPVQTPREAVTVPAAVPSVRTAEPVQTESVSAVSESRQTGEIPYIELPRGYGEITLGMKRDSVETLLKSIPAFGYRGERDVSFLPASRQTIIETPGGTVSFFNRSWFQFYEDTLYIITINLNPSKTDHYSIFSSLHEKYGEPFFISPEKSEWRNGETVFSLEKPLTLKYIDAKIFDSLTENAAAAQTYAEQSHREFLEGL